MKENKKREDEEKEIEKQKSKQQLNVNDERYQNEKNKNEKLKKELKQTQQEVKDKLELLNVKIEILWNKKRKHRREAERQTLINQILMEKLTKRVGWETRINQIEQEIRKMDEVKFRYTIITSNHQIYTHNTQKIDEAVHKIQELRPIKSAILQRTYIEIIGVTFYSFCFTQNLFTLMNNFTKN